VAYLSIGRYDEALGSFRKVTEIAPDLPAGYSNMAAAYMYQGQYRKAIEPLTLAIQRKPTVLAYSNLSTCYNRLGDSARAIESGEQAVALDPANEIAAGNLADAYRQSGQNGKAAAGFQRAIQLAYAALQTNPRKADVMGRLAVYYAKAHQFDSAQQFIERARRTDPSDAELLFDAGLVDAIRGDQAASLRNLGLALQKGFAVAQIERAPELSNLRQTRAYREFSLALRARRN
jgi:tetratricopeptide (TPR) repeat protein